MRIGGPIGRVRGSGRESGRQLQREQAAVVGVAGRMGGRESGLQWWQWQGELEAVVGVAGRMGGSGRSGRENGRQGGSGRVGNSGC